MANLFCGANRLSIRFVENCTHLLPYRFLAVLSTTLLWMIRLMRPFNKRVSSHGTLFCISPEIFFVIFFLILHSFLKFE